MNSKEFRKLALFIMEMQPVVILGATLSHVAHIIRNSYYNEFPKTEQVQQGYVIPSNLEIKLRDLDRNGEDEVLMIYNGESYLLRLDEQGRPQVQTYEVEVVPR